MTNKPLIVLGVVTALAVAGGWAKAASCVSGSNLNQLMALGTSGCTEDDLIFSDFSFPTLTGDSNSVRRTVTTATFSIVAGEPTIMFENPSAISGTGSDNRLFGNQTLMYTVTTSSPSLLIDGATMQRMAFKPVNSPSTLNLTTTYTSASTTLLSLTRVTGPNEFDPITGSFTHSVQSVRVGNVGIQPSDTWLTELRNSFSTTTSSSVPEPMSLSLFGLGLAGLALARRRRS